MEQEIKTARGLCKADLVLKNGNIINVFSERIEIGDVAITNGKIVGIGQYEGVEEIDCTGRYISPGFMDGHIHLESSMMKPVEFARVVLPHGTTGVITDPHEITNVCGKDGLSYMLEATDGLPLSVYFVLPSCVPAAPLDEAGAEIKARDLVEFYESNRVLGLAEMMNYVGVLAGDKDVLRKIQDAKKHGGVVDGHAPGLTGKDLNAYIAAGVESDHECSTAEEAIERIKRGQWVMVRLGTACKNLENLMPMFQHPYSSRAMLVTDDKHPGDLLMGGHIDYIIREAIRMGASPCTAIKMGSFNVASYFGVDRVGAVAPGYAADITILSDLYQVTVTDVFKNGVRVVTDGQVCPIQEPVVEEDLDKSVKSSVHMQKLTLDDFMVKGEGEQIRVIDLQPGEVLTHSSIERYTKEHNGSILEQDIIKLAVIERHKATGHVGLGYIRGYGLQKGAIASTVAHDSHNLIIAGTNEQDMLLAAECIEKQQGGWVVVADGEILGSLPLSIAGLMCDWDAITMEEKIRTMKELAAELGVSQAIDPYMTLAFVSLPVIPELKLTTSGLVDVATQTLLSTRF